MADQDVLEKIERNFQELGLLTNYLKDQNTETLEIVETFSRELVRIKKKCSTLPWAMKTFEKILENFALRATLMAGNVILLKERESILETMEKEVESLEKKEKEYHKKKQKIISVLNVLKASHLSINKFEPGFKKLIAFEKALEMKKYRSFSHIERDINPLLEESSQILKEVEEEKRKLLTEEKTSSFPEVQQYMKLVENLEEFEINVDSEKKLIENLKRALKESNYSEWSKIFHELQEGTDTLKKKVALIEKLQQYFAELKNTGMDAPLSEARVLYDAGNFLKAEHKLKILKEKYEKMKKEKEGRKKIVEGLLLQCKRMLDDLPSELVEDFNERYQRVQQAVEGSPDEITDDFLDEVQTFKTEMEHTVSAWMEKKEREEVLEKSASELRGKITELKKELKKYTTIFEDFGCKKENIERFQSEFEDMRKEIAAALAGSRGLKELSENDFRSLGNRLSRVDVRTEDARRMLTSSIEIYDLFEEYRESHMELFLQLPKISDEEVEEDLGSMRELLKEHLFDPDFPVEAIFEKMKSAEIELKEKEIILKESLRKIERMKNELAAIRGDFGLMGYSRDQEYFKEKMEKIFEGEGILTDEKVQEIEEKKKELVKSMKGRIFENIEEEIEILERIKKEGNIERHKSFVEEIIGISEKYGFSELKSRAEKLIGISKVRKCPYLDCEGDIEGDVQFCPHCGRKIVLCSCGRFNREESRFCVRCGSLLRIEEYIKDYLEREDSISFEDLMEEHLDEEKAKQAIKTFFDKYGPDSEAIGYSLDMKEFRIYKVKKTCEEKILELLPVHGAISAEDLENCTSEDVVNFYERYKDKKQELGYEIELIGDMIVKK